MKKKSNRDWLISKVGSVSSSTELKNLYDNFVTETGSKSNKKTYGRECERVWKDFREGNLGGVGSDDSVSLKQTKDGPNYAIVSTSAKIRTLEELLAFCNVDMNKWKVDKHVINSWGSEENENFQVKAWLSEICSGDILPEQQAEQFKEFVKDYKPDYSKINNIKRYNSNNMLEISLPDFHFGQLSWKKEVGVSYDVKIAERLWMDAISYYAKIAKEYKVKKFLLPLGNDFFNVDNTGNTTTAGTPQDEDGRWQRTFSHGWQLMVKGIDVLLRIADVDVIIIPGNHDTERTYYMGEVLKAWYQNCKGVSIDNKPTNRKYYKFGNNLIGMSHGKEGKIQDFPIVMAMEAKDLFCSTSFWEFQIGHFHHDRRLVLDVLDHKSMKIRIMPSIVPFSAYSKKHAYMSVREGIGLLWDEKEGKVAEFSYYPRELDG